jgi:hypothetical protein
MPPDTVVWLTSGNGSFTLNWCAWLMSVLGDIGCICRCTVLLNGEACMRMVIVSDEGESSNDLKKLEFDSCKYCTKKTVGNLLELLTHLVVATKMIYYLLKTQGTTGITNQIECEIMESWSCRLLVVLVE